MILKSGKNGHFGKAIVLKNGLPYFEANFKVLKSNLK